MSKVKTISDYLIQQLGSYGVQHVFGVPGDFALKFYNELELSQLQVVNTADAQGAGFAADAYARVRGLGVVCVTYAVGGFCVANTKKGKSKPIVLLPIVTCFSCIASNKAACVFGVALLISSTNNILVNTGPFSNLNTFL